ncbi:upf0481 protein [Quercus suber]|uniref:Upf0481 protein n=1 Tax=Quercus suber TaxID=58331 RepID=A0AAW0LRC6_QUESU
MAENEVDSAAIDAECLVHSIKARMSPDLFMSPNRCIFKTPTILRELNEKAYVPDAFSIGPFHHGEPKFEEMEKIKSKYLQGLISRSLLPDEMLTNLINSIKDVEREAREFYAGPIVCSRDEFVEMLVIDGCFIIELFCKQVFTELRGDNDPIFSTACMRQFLAHDLILLENQVPWIILERLFNLAMHLIDNNARQFLAHDLLENQEPRIKRDHLFNLAMDLTHNNANAALIGLVKSFVTKSLGIDLLPAHPPNQEIKHILDLIRKLLVSSTRADEDPTDWTTLPSATSLVEAGVKIRKGESKSFLDIKFDNGVLYIPQLEIQETTESFFRNIISFEQCYPNYSAASDTECLVHSIKARMSPDLFMSPNRCIFKTPTILRELNEKAYVPDAFSIGPFDHGEPKFEEMEKIKSKYLQGLISRSLLPDEMLTNLINSIKDVEREAREFYAGPIVCSRDEFVEMLVFTELRGDNDPIFSTAYMGQFLAHDLILLENQVPWIILERLFNLAMHLIDNNARQFLAHDLLENQEPRIKRDHLGCGPILQQAVLQYTVSLKPISRAFARKWNEYCNRRWPKWRAVLVGKYFNTPWAVLSTVGAVILLISPS